MGSLSALSGPAAPFEEKGSLGTRAPLFRKSGLSFGMRVLEWPFVKRETEKGAQAP